MTGAPRYFLTAYGIAVKHGYQGTEEEWLTSLTAYGMAVAMGYEGTEEEWLQKLTDPVPDIVVDKTITIEAGLPARVEISGTKERPVFSFYIPRGAGMEDALLRTGDTMSGIFNMDGFPLIGLPEPAEDDGAVNKRYADVIAEAADKAKKAAEKAKEVADAALPRAGAVMEGSIDMNGFGITNLPAPETDGSAANRYYVDGKRKAFSVDVPVSGWTGEGPYTQTVAVDGILSNDKPHICLVPDDNANIAVEQEEAWGCVSRGVTADGYITFTCYEDKPEVNIPLQIEVNR